MLNRRLSWPQRIKRFCRPFLHNSLHIENNTFNERYLSRVDATQHEQGQHSGIYIFCTFKLYFRILWCDSLTKVKILLAALWQFIANLIKLTSNGYVNLRVEVKTGPWCTWQQNSLRLYRFLPEMGLLLACPETQRSVQHSKPLSKMESNTQLLWLCRSKRWK